MSQIKFLVKNVSGIGKIDYAGKNIIEDKHDCKC